MYKKALFALADGTLFYGRSRSHEGYVCSEIVFNTAQTGYQEVCTDPSYIDQMVVFTTTHIGNVGVNSDDNENEFEKVWVKGVVVREMARCTSNWRAQISFEQFLAKEQVPWIEGVDTRKLVRRLRQTGSQKGCLMVGNICPVKAVELANSMPSCEGQDLFAQAIRLESVDYTRNSPDNERAPLICVYDFGVKLNILKCIKGFPYRVKIIPGTACADELLRFQPDGVIISNGPGDPGANKQIIENVKKLIFSGVPILGICLGHQLIGIAAGGQALKMKFGHHGINHPIYDLKRGKVFITSQNHNFEISCDALPQNLEVTHYSLFDGSIQGLHLKGYPVWGFQGHPEGGPGPQDVRHLFQDFFAYISSNQRNQSSLCPVT